ncbi:MAG TPA: helix-turn-helix domain-containing protein, partial [Chryseolinea sp.]|nr:helix-turn-helix domain-containing protein [Chryseolinea sp.]
LVRTMKGRDYYRAMLWDQVKLLAHHTKEMRSVKRVKGYLSDLADLDQLLTKKFEEVDKVFHMAETIVKQHDEFDFTLLSTERASLRAALELEIGVTPNGKSKVKVKKGRRKKKGTQEKNTYDISLELANQGLTVDEIAIERRLVRGTIESHLAKAVEGGHISIFKFMDQERVERIATALQEMEHGFTSSELYTKLNGNFTYGELRAVMNHTGIKPASIKEPKEEPGDS